MALETERKMKDRSTQRNIYLSFAAFILLNIVFVVSCFIILGYFPLPGASDPNNLFTINTWHIISSAILSIGFYFICGLLGYKKQTWFLGVLALLFFELIFFPNLYCCPFFTLIVFVLVDVNAGPEYWALILALFYNVLFAITVPLVLYIIGRLIGKKSDKKRANKANEQINT